MATGEYMNNDIDLDDTSYYEDFIDLYRSLLGNTEVFLQFSKEDKALYKVATKAEDLATQAQKYCANNSQMQESLDNASKTYKAYKQEKISAFKLAKKAINNGVCENNLQECKNSLATLIKTMRKHNQNLKKYIKIVENLLSQNPNKQSDDVEKLFLVTYSLLFGNSGEFFRFRIEAERMDYFGRYAEKLHEITKQQGNQVLQREFDKALQTYQIYEEATKEALEIAQNAIDDGICEDNLHKCKESLATVVETMVTHNQTLEKYINIAKKLLPKKP